jgi:uncharacterized protein YndB with AHSA1/START domain
MPAAEQHRLARLVDAPGGAEMMGAIPPDSPMLRSGGLRHLRADHPARHRGDLTCRPAADGDGDDDGAVAVDVLTEIVIDRPCAGVAEYAGDPSRAPLWYANIESVDWRTPPPVRIGSRMDFVARFLGRRLAYTYEIVELVPGERLVMRTAQGPFPMETTYTWQPLDDARTRMTLRNRGEPAGFGRMAAPVMAAAMRRANQKDLANLKSILERQDPG